MKTRDSELTRLALALGMAVWAAGLRVQAQEGASLELRLDPERHPIIRVAAETGTTWVIESKTAVEADFWLTRGWIELTGPIGEWVDPVPRDSPHKIYRALKVIRPVLQTVSNMVWIAPGTFTMGCPPSERGGHVWEHQQTRVTLTQGFWIGQYELTQREYVAVMQAAPPGGGTDPDRPVDGITWREAAAYCAELTERERAAGRLPAGSAYRLPTEAQWEYACRAGTTTSTPFGDALECDEGCGFCAVLDAHEWWCGNRGEAPTHPVGQKLPNPWGVYDMLGNATEWCQDRWSENLPGGVVVDPQGPAEGSDHVFRGGDWVPWGNYARHCRSANRYFDAPDDRQLRYGFRTVLVSSQP